MRDFLVTAVITVLAVVALGRPDVGVLAWTWVSMMNPHRMTWGFAYEMQVAMIVAIATFVGLLFYRGPKRIPLTAPVVLLLLFDLWMVATHFAGFNPELVQERALAIAKVQLMVFVTVLLLYHKWHINAFVGIVVFSIAFFGVKGGIFTIASGGSFHVWGPPDSALEGNNEIALALIMTIPLMYYFFTLAKGKWSKWGLVIAMILCAAAALGSQSRGALVAIAAMTGVLWLRSHRKFAVAFVLLLSGVVLIGMMPSTWEERMQTITEYEQDLSALQRLDVWKLCWNIALAHPFMGGGYGIYTEELNAIYNPGAIGGLRNAHSIYFSVVAEQGFVGLALFVAIWFSVWRACARVRRLTAGVETLSWAFWLASMLQVSLVGYLVGGAFLYLAYADFPYNLLIASVVLLDHVKRELGTAVTAPERAGSRLGRFGAEPIR